LDRAIKVDKTYKTAYSNELSYLCQLGERERALQTVNQIIDFGTMLGDWKLMKGHILERMDRHDEADQAYREALTEFEKDINTKPNDVKSQLGKAQVMLFLRGKDAGIMEYNKIKEQYPDNKLVLNMRQEFYDFNKGKVLSSFCK
jgi:tetratricopeptide (TPR) repeat protein